MLTSYVGLHLIWKECYCVSLVHLSYMSWFMWRFSEIWGLKEDSPLNLMQTALVFSREIFLLPCISCGLMWGPQLHFDIFIFEYSGAHEEIKTQGFEPLTSSVRSKGNGCCEDLNVQSRLFDHLALICIYVSAVSLLSLSFFHLSLFLS